MKLSGEQIINARISLIDAPAAGCTLSNRQGAASYGGCFGAYPLQLRRHVIGLHRQRDSEPTGLEQGTPTEERAAGASSPCCQCPARRLASANPPEVADGGSSL